MLLLLSSIAAFLIINAASYFARSTGYGVQRGWQDGIVQVGFPFLIYESGEFDYRRIFSLKALFGNFLVTTATVFIVSGAAALLARSESAKADD